MPFVASLIGLLAVALTWPRVKGSTLVGPWIWTLGFFVTLAAASSVAASSAQSVPIRYGLACLSFCPAVSLLGAKRPQHTMWHFIVATFGGMMMLPAFEVLVLQPGQALELMDLRGWFLWALLLGCWINRWGTRLFVPATLLFAAQLLAFAPLLPLWRSSTDYWLAAVILWSAAAVGEAWLTRRRQRNVHRWDALWLDYRDRFGVVWAARVRERVNAVAESSGWNLELAWQGFRAKAIESSGEVEGWNTDMAQRLVTVLANVLRRFLSPQELQQRADELLNAEPPIDV